MKRLSWIQTAHRPGRCNARVGCKITDDIDSYDDNEPTNYNDKQVAKITSVAGKRDGDGDT